MSDESPQRRRESRRFSMLGIGLALLLATATFFSGLHVSSLTGAGNAQAASLFSLFEDPVETEDIDMIEFWRVWQLLERKFATASSGNSVSVDDRMRGAIKGLVQSYGDPYTVYLPPTDAAFFEEDISGNFSGVGMEVGMRNNVVTVISPLPDTPAEKAGLLAGDAIVSIDGKSTENMGIDEAVRLIRGEKGTVVELSIYREGEPEFIDIPVTRDQISIPTIDTEQHGDVFVIKLFSFNAIAEMKMQEALREYERSGADKLIFDLRGNPGGFLQSAVAISSFFLPTGKIVVRESFGEDLEEEEYRSTGKVFEKFSPEDMVVLIDRGSASASEIVAGALSQHGVATLMGEKSFGKGSVQELVDLPTGASLKVTIARWLTPDGTSISNGGLTPDYEVPRSVEDRQEDIDPQLEAAIDFLNGEYEPEENERD